MRESLESVVLKQYGRKIFVHWDKDNETEVSYREGLLVGSLTGVLSRRLLASHLAAGQDAAIQVDSGRFFAALPDIAAFIAGDTDDQRILDLLWGFSLIGFASGPALKAAQERAFDAAYGAGDEVDDAQFEADSSAPPALFALLRLAFASHPIKNGGVDGIVPPIDPAIFRLAASGQGERAAQRAIRRLRGVGLVSLVSSCGIAQSQRAAVALAFPVAANAYFRGLQGLPNLVLQPPTE